MRRRLLNIFILLAPFIFLPNLIFGCSQAYAKISQFPKHIYVFTGEIIGYTDKFESKEIHGEAYGFKIKPVDVLNAPIKAKDFYEVFPFKLEADCSHTGYNLDELKSYFLSNSKVRVMAVEAGFLKGGSQSSQVPLQAFELNENHIKNRYSFSTNSIFDYENSKYQQYSDLQFELYKDLLRIEKAKTLSNKVKILNRLVYFQGYWLDFESLLKQHLSSKTAQKLNNKRKAFLKKKFQTK